VRLAALLVLLSIAFASPAAVPAGAAENPFTGKPAAGDTAKPGPARNPLTGTPAPGGAAKPGPPAQGSAVETTWLGDAARWLYAMQRRANRAIAEHMAEIREGRSMTPLLVGILLALLYGAVHTLGPGHGKFVVVTYFLARRAKVSKGLWMGLQIAVTHVVAAVVAVFMVDLALRHFLGGAPGQLRTVRLLSYALIAVIGLYMLVQAIRRAFGKVDAHGHHHHPGHDHGHGHGHGHGHDLGQGQGGTVKAGGRQMTLLSLSVGLVPCTGALLVMIYAIANDILLAGTIIVAAISIGMAGMLAVLAVASILFRRAVEAGIAHQSDRPSRWSRGIEIVGGLAITLVGVLLFAGVIWQPGV